MDVKGNGFLPKRNDAVRADPKNIHMNGHVYTGEVPVKKPLLTAVAKGSSDPKSEFFNAEDYADHKYRKERDKKDATLDNGFCKPGSTTIVMDQDLEFYPTDDFSSSPSTFSAWDAFMTGNQAFFREPPCYPADYVCTESFSYMDVIPEEEDDVSVLESDTDDTGSSVSTVIDKFSRTSTANSSFSERIRTAKEEPPMVTFDLEKVLSPFEQLEKELDEDVNCPCPVVTSQNGPVVIVTGTAGSCESASAECPDNDDTEMTSDSSKPEEEEEETCEKSAVIHSSESPKNEKETSLTDDSKTSHASSLCSEKQRETTLKGESKGPKPPIPEKPPTNETPPLPSRMSNRNSNSSNNSKYKKDSPDKSAFHRSDSYHAPIVPPRHTKHVPARRTRSDPGSSEPSTPSRIPRPTFTVRSASSNDKANAAGQRNLVAKGNKNPSPKSTPPKRLKFPKNFDFKLDRSVSKAATQQAAEKNLESAASDKMNNFEEAANESTASAFVVTSSDFPFGSPCSENDIYAVKSSNVDCIQSDSNTERRENQSGSKKADSNDKSKSSTEGLSRKGERSQHGLTQDESSLESNFQRKLEPSTASSGPESNSLPPGPENSKPISIPQIHIIEEDDEMVVEEDLGCITEVGSQLQDMLDTTGDDDSIEVSVDDDNDGDDGSSCFKQESKNDEDTLQHAEEIFEDCKAQFEDEANDQNIRNGAVDGDLNHIGTENDKPHDNSALTNVKNAGNVFDDDDGESKSIECEKNCSISKRDKEEIATKPVCPNQRPLEDILQALDNLCLASSMPKEVEINIDWGPTDDSGINIKQKILSSGSTSSSGSTIEDDTNNNDDFAVDEIPEDRNQMVESAFLANFKVGESQQTTQCVEPLPASAAKSPPTTHINSEYVDSWVQSDDEDRGEQKAERFGQDIETKRNQNNNNNNETEETAAAAAVAIGHALATTGGHCHLDSSNNNNNNNSDPSRDDESQSVDVIPDDSEMDALKTLRSSDFVQGSLKYSGERENKIITNGTTHPVSDVQDILTINKLNEKQSLRAEAEETPTRHSSGCDDSGVFLEDLPYTPDTALNGANEESTSDRLNKDDYIQQDMKLYNLDPQLSLDSDAERSDDLGLASSSIDSADDLDGDPLPSSIKINAPPPPPIKKKPPPVPPRKFVSKACCELKPNVETNVMQSLDSNDVESIPLTEEKTFKESFRLSPPQKRSSESYKWKSEECLRSAMEMKWNTRNSEKTISVKDRIAMFSEMESNPNKSDSATLHRFTSDTNIKSNGSIDQKGRTPSTSSSNSKEFPSLNNSTKWYSMYSLPMSVVTQSETDNASKMQPMKPSTSISSLEPMSLQDNYTDDPKEIEIITNVTKKEVETSLPVEKPVISRYPQTQLTTTKRYSYNQYNFNTIKTTEDLLMKKTCPTSILNMMETRKQPLAKLKGLVIPEKPTPTSSSKELPTIVSSDSLILNAKTDLDIDKNRIVTNSGDMSFKTMSLPRTRNELKAKYDSSGDFETAKHVEQSWKSQVSNPTPSYYPASKSRTLELTHSVTASLSPTPPSSITSPLSPPPSSPSSICSSNASSAASIATMQQNIFQFSLSHSKPVTPVLPEKPIMSPPSLPSDIEYEGDNSEDSSTSASPMISKHNLISSKSFGKKAGSSIDSVFADAKRDSRNSFSATSSLSTEKSNGYHAGLLTICTSEKDLARKTAHNFTNIYPITTMSSTLDRCGELDRPRYTETRRHSIHHLDCNGSSNDDHGFGKSLDHGNEQQRGKSTFYASSQQVQSTKFRAQPLVLKQGSKQPTNGVSPYFNDRSSFCEQPSTVQSSSGRTTYKDSDHRNDFSVSDNERNYVSEYKISLQKKPVWPHSSELMPFKRMESEDDDDSRSSISHRTEDSRPTTEDYFSDATTDSCDKSLDPDLKPRRLSQQRVVLKAASRDGTDSVQKFKALAEKWELRADVQSPPPPTLPTAPAALAPTPRKDSKTYAGPIPVTSSFLSSIINSSTSTKVSNSSSSSAVKLPPSLMPRSKQTSDKNQERGSGKCRSQKGSPDTTDGRYEPRERRSSKTSHEWMDERMAKSFNSASFSDSGSSTDTGSTCSKSERCRIEKVKNFINSDYNLMDTSLPSKMVSTQNNRHESFDASKTQFSKDNNGTDRVTAGSSEVLNSRMKTTYSANDLQNIRQRDNVKNISTVQNVRPDTRDRKADLSSETLTRMSRTESKERMNLLWSTSLRDKDLSRTRNLSKSQVSLRDPLESVRSHGISYLSSVNSKSVSVSDIRKAFETQCIQNQSNSSANQNVKVPPIPPRSTTNPIVETKRIVTNNNKNERYVIDHRSDSSFDSTIGYDSETASPTRYGSVGSLTCATPDAYDSINSIDSAASSSTSHHELQKLIDDANQTLKESSNGEFIVDVITLLREVPSGSIGITLAGGADYEVKEITVHKVISGSLADRDGRIRKGDRIISINGKNLKNVTHREALDILKAPRPEVVLVISREKANDSTTTIRNSGSRNSQMDRSSYASNLDSSLCSKNTNTDALSTRKVENADIESGSMITVELFKDGAGLGFSLEGGKDSPLGDRPLVIKRIFKGGIADKNGQLAIGDEIISVNGQSVANMTRTEAWNFLKKLPDELITVRARKNICLS